MYITTYDDTLVLSLALYSDCFSHIHMPCVFTCNWIGISNTSVMQRKQFKLSGRICDRKVYSSIVKAEISLVEIKFGFYMNQRERERVTVDVPTRFASLAIILAMGWLGDYFTVTFSSVCHFRGIFSNGCK